MLANPRRHSLSRYDTFNWIIIGMVIFAFILRVAVIYFNPLLVEEAYYWQYANHLDFSYLDHPPMVALLIKASTYLFGLNEWAVRISALFCWLGTVYFSIRLTKKIASHAGIYALLLLCVMPFFVFSSVVITPDAPLMFCWSALLYYLHQALVEDKKGAWYLAGVALGLGMLSKYTIALVVPAALLYLVIMPDKRRWFFSYQPYIASLIALIIFSPVIYWNATHEWASFLFQTARRVNAPIQFSLHRFLLLMLVFFTHLGVYSVTKLFTRTSTEYGLNLYNKRFVQLMLLFPLSVFALFSFTHRVNFDWIGPLILAAIPWFALSIDRARTNTANNLRQYWLILSGTLLLLYGGLAIGIYENLWVNPKSHVFGKFIDWEDFAFKINQIAKEYETVNHETPVIVPRDPYNLASELAFYQKRLVKQGQVEKSYAIIGEHIIGLSSLMYDFWDKERPRILTNPVILIGYDKVYFNEVNKTKYLQHDDKLRTVWVKSMGGKEKGRPFYYKIVKLKKPY